MRHHTLSRGHVRAVVLALACVLSVAACKGGSPDGAAPGEDGKKGPEAVTVEVAAVETRPVAASYSGTAPLEAPAEAQVVAKTSGVALSVLVEEGDVVRAGQTLVRLDASRAELQAAQTAAQMNKLQNQFARAQTLAKEQLIAASDYDQIRYDLENARAANRLANLELSYAAVKAPISGVVASVTPKPGNFVQINTPIVRIVDTSTLEAVLNVPERELATMQAGLPVDLRVDALPGKTFTGTIDRISPVVDSGSGTFRVIAEFDSGGLLQPGMFGRIGIDYDKRANATVVPRAALLDAGTNAAVFAVRDGKAARVPVTLGYMDGQWAEVREGLAVGEQVVVAGKAALRDGSAVTVIGQPGDKAVAASEGGAVAPVANNQ
ncbi:MAG: efflux RND transporter periplasmic adaptor subunit [Lysobacter sp.]|uniref:Efflux RND transporter periplasmic adaptor subunit n=2 Tax=Lysobacteraceae TaxID=32033 RepID=A0ABU7YPG8_9GAMM|nr:efflux RND transporter periplasmic adaptor subunit [Lysobacter luteus]MDV3255974.1 efflux RND transporter periplasmic adaptor subunit [Lysobacter sp.]MDV5981971.1 efflux RND transporter periplasmic adaptor subunit [Lysobacter sp.]CAG4972845.1 Multidrug resistance protein MdtA [Lysobacter luteus]